MSTQHTPEPWSLVGGAALPYTQIIHGAKSIGKIGKAEDARRISACVNACTGMADPAAEITRLRAELAALVRGAEMLDDYCMGGSRPPTYNLAAIHAFLNKAANDGRASLTAKPDYDPAAVKKGGVAPEAGGDARPTTGDQPTGRRAAGGAA